MTRRFWVAVALTVPVVVLEMGAELVGDRRRGPRRHSAWLQLRPRDPGRAVGRVAVLHAGLDLGAHA